MYCNRLVYQKKKTKTEWIVQNWIKNVYSTLYKKAGVYTVMMFFGAQIALYFDIE